MIYLGNFVHFTNQQDESEVNRRHGEFNLIVQADDSNSAIELFKRRIIEIKETSELFEGKCRIYFTQLLEFDRLPTGHAALLNFKSIAGDPAMPFIGCTLPSREQEVCRIFDWSETAPSIDGDPESLFLQYER